MNPWLMGLIVAFCSLLGPRFAVGADPVYIVKEVGEIYDTAGTIDAKPRVCHLQYSVVSVAESDETMTRYSAKGFVRIKHDTRSSELLTEVLDPNRPRYSTPESGAVGVITYGDVVDRDTGNRNPVPFGKVWINYAAPRFGFELFCTPGLSLSDVRRSAATWGISRFHTYPQFVPQLEGSWSYRKTARPDDSVRITGPFLATAHEHAVQISGWLEHDLNKDGTFKRSQGHSLVVVHAAKEIKRIEEFNLFEEIDGPVYVHYYFEMSQDLGQRIPRELTEHLRDVTGEN